MLFSEQTLERGSDDSFNPLDQRSKSTLVIVHQPSTSDPVHGPGRVEDDPLFKKLDDLPMFVPLMHEVETGSKLLFGGSRNRALQEIRSKLHPTPFITIVRLYEDRLKRHADCINVEQGRLSKCIREIDIDVAHFFKTLIERQKKFAKHAENMGKMNDLTHTLTKCQSMLKECERNLQILNGFLPQEDRLEPFSWPELVENVETDQKSDAGSGVQDDKCSPAAVKLVPTTDYKANSDDESIEIAMEQGES